MTKIIVYHLKTHNTCGINDKESVTNTTILTPIRYMAPQRIKIYQKIGKVFLQHIPYKLLK